MAHGPWLSLVHDRLLAVRKQAEATRPRVSRATVQRIAVVHGRYSLEVAPRHEENSGKCWCDPVVTEDEDTIYVYHREFDN